VRAHLADAGFPIVGDAVYGERADAGASVSTAGLHLHAWSVHLRHPTTGVPLLVEAPPPAWAILRA
jgi:23S rRNA-/tRNA-specific pseudouridylate synthase